VSRSPSPRDPVEKHVHPVVFAKTSPHVLDPPAFALHLALHFVSKYAHIHRCFIDIIALKWSRIDVRSTWQMFEQSTDPRRQVDGKPHNWSFVRDGEEKGLVECAVDATGGVENAKASLRIGLKDLLGKCGERSEFPSHG
jgi:urate oxidase